MDADLRVIVTPAEGTLMAHDPSHMHGTTTTCGWIMAGFALVFSQRLKDAWVAAGQGIRAVLGGTGVQW